MKKKSVSMLLATAMVVSLLTGCGSKNNSVADTTKEETQTEATAEAAADESNDTTAELIQIRAEKAGLRRKNK